MSQARVSIRIDADNKASKAVGEVKSQFRQLGDEIKDALGSRLTQALSLGAIAFGIRQVTQAAAELQAALTGLAAVAQAFGEDQKVAQIAAQELADDGLMTVSHAATGLKNLLAAGFGLPEAIRLMEVFKDAAAFNRQAALSFGQAVVSATEGIKNGNSILVDNAGITKNLSVILQEAGFSAQDLMRASQDAGVRMAIFNGIVKESAPFLGNAAIFAGTAAGEMARMGVESERAQQILGLKLQPVVLKLAHGFNTVVLPVLKVFIAAIETVGAALGGLTEILNQVVLRLGRFGVQVRQKVLELANGLLDIARQVPFVGGLLGITGVDQAAQGFLDQRLANARADLAAFEADIVSFADVVKGAASVIGDSWREAFAPFRPTVTVPGGARVDQGGGGGASGRTRMALPGVEGGLADSFGIGGLREGLREFVPEFQAHMKHMTDSMLAFQQAVERALADSLVRAFESFGEAVVSSFENLDGAFKGLLGAIVGLLGDIMIRAGTAIVLTSKAFAAFQAALASLFPGGGIVAGAALIAAGAAMKAAAGSFLSGSSGGFSGGGVSAGLSQSQQALEGRGQAVITLRGSWRAVMQDPDAQDSFAALLRELTGRDVVLETA